LQPTPHPRGSAINPARSAAVGADSGEERAHWHHNRAPGLIRINDNLPGAP
jgi:hypothetical protein